MTDFPPSPESQNPSGSAAGASSGAARLPEAIPYDFRKASQPGERQFQSFRLMHENLGPALDRSLGGALRCPVAAALTAVEQRTYEALRNEFSEATFLCALALPRLELAAALELDAAVLMPVLDLLLGGSGEAGPQPRPVTEIEEQILSRAVKVICQQLESIWQPLLGSEVRFDRRVPPQQFPRLMPAAQRLAVLRFEFVAGAARGRMSIALPTAASNALLRGFVRQWTPVQRATAGGSRAQLQQRLQKCRLPVELVLSGVRASLLELTALEPGQVLAFRRRVEEPARLLANGEAVFAARPVAAGSKRAAQILEPLAVFAGEER